MPVSFKFIAKRELFRIPFFGWAIKRAGYISIDRENPREALKAIEEAVRKIKEGTPVLIFPEGTRSTDGRPAALHEGRLFPRLPRRRACRAPRHRRQQRAAAGRIDPVAAAAEGARRRSAWENLYRMEGKGLSYKAGLMEEVRGAIEEADVMSEEIKKEIIGIGLLGLFLFLFVSLLSYHPFDPSLNTRGVRQR